MDALASLLYIIYGILDNDFVMMGSAIMPFLSQLIILFLWKCYKNIDIIDE